MADKRFPPSELAAPPHTEDEDESYIDFNYDKPGSMPGTLLLEDDAPPPAIVLIDYCQSNATRVQLDTPEACIPYLDTESVSWVDVLGLGNENIWRRMGQVFDLHPLVLEDVVNVPQRPKVDDLDSQLVIIARMVMPKEKGNGFYSEQVSFVLSEHYLLTVQVKS
jgi:magnesium transporter